MVARVVCRLVTAPKWKKKYNVNRSNENINAQHHNTADINGYDK